MDLIKFLDTLAEQQVQLLDIVTKESLKNQEHNKYIYRALNEIVKNILIINEENEFKNKL
jgi:hypothetical protein